MDEYEASATAANAASEEAKKGNTKLLHSKAAGLHRIAAEHAKLAGKDDEATMHSSKAFRHSNAMQACMNGKQAAALATKLVELSGKRASGNAALQASIAANGFSFSDLQAEIRNECLEIEELNEPAEGAISTGPACWVADIIAPAHEAGEVWEAIVQGADGKLYCVNFEINADHEVKIVGEPEEVERTTDYKYVDDMETEARAAVLDAGGPGSGPRKGGGSDAKDKDYADKASHAAKKSQEAYNESAKLPDEEDNPDKHGNAAYAHHEAADAHNKAAGAARNESEKSYHKGMSEQHSRQANAHEHGNHMSARAAATGTELQADFRGNQHKTPGDVADEHAAAANVASRKANAASRGAKDQSGHQAAATAHGAAKDAHAAAATKHESAGNDDEAAEHKAKADKHDAKAKEHGAAVEACQQRMKARAAKKLVSLDCARKEANALRTHLDVISEGVIMVMPGGIHTITPSQNGRPVTVTVEVNEASAAKLEEQRKALEAAGKKPFFSIQHETEIAAFWPSRFFWDKRIDATGSMAEGVWAEGEWTKSGKEAVEGKDFRTFSPTFFVDAVRDDPDNPAQIVCNEDARANMGALENDPAFQSLSPLWCRNMGTAPTGERVKALRQIVRDCHEALRASNPTLEELQDALLEKHKLKLSRREVGTLLIGE